MAFSYKSYTESDAVKKKRQEAEDNSTYKASDSVNLAKSAMDAHEANKVADWTGGTYGDALQGAIDKISNREKFSYDLNGDALYQQYKDQYINQGKLAMADAIGQASAMTGGYGNSYAATVGNQQYQAYLQKLNDVVPELYQMAYDKYNQEGQDLYNQANLYNNMYNQEYGEYRDKVSDWNTEANRLSDKYYNEANLDYSKFTDTRDYLANQYNNERTYDYGQYTDAYNRAFANYQQGVSEDQWNKSYALQKQQADQSATIASLKAQLSAKDEQYSGYISPEVQKAANSSATKTFQASVLTPSELAKRRYQTNINGKSTRFDNYTQYVDAVLEKQYKAGQLTENEVAYLKGYYGIE